MQTLIEQRLDHSIGQQALAANVGDLRTAPVERELKVRLQDFCGSLRAAASLQTDSGTWVDQQLVGDAVSSRSG